MAINKPSEMSPVVKGGVEVFGELYHQVDDVVFSPEAPPDDVDAMSQEQIDELFDGLLVTRNFQQYTETVERRPQCRNFTVTTGLCCF